MTDAGTTETDGADRRLEWGGLTMWATSVSAMDNNAYLLRCRRTGELLLVDAADEAGRLLELVRTAGGDLRTVVTTHQHWDHHRALAEVVAGTHAATACGADDAEGMPVPTDRLLVHGDVVQVGDVPLEVVHLRGHTPGSVALAYRDPDGPVQLFTGDSLFPGGVGNTKNPGQSFDQLFADVSTRVFDVFADDTVVWPGHGASTTVGTERPHLPGWRARGW
jgi:glyoxylase-like metal-dependent hydrolase (beta-lactamase superfamily II)